jgi:tRNA threonylcarbamoyladenosine biosynthesis protein TsaB
MEPVLLAFDTSTEQLALALQAGTRTWLADEPGGALASSTLLPRISAMLADAGVAAGDVAAVAFGRGPGAFTGLRTSAAVAQGLALGWGVPVLPVDSLLIVAEDAREQWAAPSGDGDAEPFVAAVLMDARMGQVYAGVYRCWQGRWETLAAPGLFDPAALAPGWSALRLSCAAGSALDAFGERLGLPAGLPQRPQSRARAAALLRLARAGWAAGQTVDAALGMPLYVRDKVALTTLEREARA